MKFHKKGKTKQNIVWGYIAKCKTEERKEKRKGKKEEGKKKTEKRKEGRKRKAK